MGRPGALLFDFNGTLSDDEPLVCRLFVELFAELGRPLSSDEYFERFAGHTDAEIVRSWLGPDFPDVDAIVDERIARYLTVAADGSTVPEAVREAVLYAAERAPVAVVSSAARAEIETVLEGAGLAGAIRAVVSIDDVSIAKPAAEPYERALDLLDRPEDAVAFEDTEVGVASALAAGLRCIAVLGTMGAERLRAAESVVPELEPVIVREVLGLPPGA